MFLRQHLFYGKTTVFLAIPLTMIFFAGNSPSVIQFRRIALEEQRQSEVLKAEQLAKECETNPIPPILRHAMQLEAQRKLEAQRDFAFQQMQDLELQRIYYLPSPTQEIPAHKQFWAWRKQAKSELEQLRETECLKREQLAQDTDTFTHQRGNSCSQAANTSESLISPSPSCPNDITNILPITTPAAFALKQQAMLDRSRTEEKASSLNRPPGKRFSVCEIPKAQCKPEHHSWLQKALGQS